MTRQCPICGTEFQTTPYRVRRGWSVYCSRACLYKGMHTGEVKQCTYCGKEIYRPKAQIEKNSRQLFFCTHNCRRSWENTQRAGESHPNWKGGESIYRDRMRRSGRARVCSLCGLTDQRVLSVHHIDGDRSNNSLDNLAWLCQNCHYLVHHFEDERERLRVKLEGKA